MGNGDSKSSKKEKDKSGAPTSPSGQVPLPETTALQNGTKNTSVKKTLAPGPLVNHDDFLVGIGTEEDWSAFCHKPTDRTFAHTSVIIVIIPNNLRVETESPIFFIHSEKWVFHWHFTRDILRDPNSQDLGKFNALNYMQDHRDFILFTVTQYHDHGMYSFELSPRDNLPLTRLMYAYQLIKKAVFFGDKLFYRPMSKIHETIIKPSTESDLPIIRSDQLFTGVKYQPLTIGTTYGYLRLVGEETEIEDVDKAKWNDILLCESIPTDLPVISGLITSVLQTPLCHVALLCGNRGTPNVGAVGAFENPELLELVGKPVKYSVKKPDYSIELATMEEVDWWQAKAFAKLRKGADIRLIGDVGEPELVRFKEAVALKGMPYDIMKLTVGAKSLNCLELVKKQIGSDLLSNSFVIPFYWYEHTISRIFREQDSKHDLSRIKSKDLDLDMENRGKWFAKFLEESKSNHSPDSKDYAITCLRIREIINSYLHHEGRYLEPGEEPPCEENPTLYDHIYDLIEKWKATKLWDRCDGLIFRSSTNAEDIEGFNAAGLYESIPVTKEDLRKHGRRTIADALSKVWASVWNFRGFEERRLFGLDSAEVKMAILVQPWFNTAQRCNGVAVTAHPSRHDFPGHHINLQRAGHLVTDSCAGIRPEQHVIWIYSGVEIVDETVCLSSLMGNLPLMSEEEVLQLVPMLNKLDKEFGHNTPTTKSNIVQGDKKTKFCVDVEFLVMKDSSEIVILQCRPYKMVYEWIASRNPIRK